MARLNDAKQGLERAAQASDETAGVPLRSLISEIDTVLAVYTGTKGNLVEVASNDDVSPQDWTSQVTMNVESGTTYHIVVDSYNSNSTGKIELEYEGELIGAATIARELICRATGAVLEARLQGIRPDAPLARGFALEMDTGLENVDRCVERIRLFLEDRNGEEHLFPLSLLAREALNNAMIHGNGMDPGKRVRFRLLEREGGFDLEIEDDGPGFDERIAIPAQEFDTPARNTFCENLSFNPWHAVEDHRPLGGLNRIRKAVYEEIAVYRHAMNGNEIYREPTGWCVDAEGKPCDAP